MPTTISGTIEKRWRAQLAFGEKMMADLGLFPTEAKAKTALDRSGMLGGTRKVTPVNILKTDSGEFELVRV